MKILNKNEVFGEEYKVIELLITLLKKLENTFIDLLDTLYNINMKIMR